MDDAQDEPRPPRRPRPARQCARYRRNGEPCPNTTAASDGWCRAPGCPGYVRPRATRDADADGGPGPGRPIFGTRRHVEATRDIEIGLEIDEIDTVRISRRARDAYLEHHLGTESGAEVALRSMLEDFLLAGARAVSPAGYVTLARDGYLLMLDPELTTVVGYDTVHRERTWEQVKAGVPSRYRRRAPKRPPALGPRARPGPPVPAEKLAGSVDPRRIHLASRALTSFDRIRGLSNLDDAALDAAVRAALGDALTRAVPGPRRDSHVTELVADGLSWLVTHDGRTLVAIARQRPGGDTP
jgi:hypothetical protein